MRRWLLSASVIAALAAGCGPAAPSSPITSTPTPTPREEPAPAPPRVPAPAPVATSESPHRDHLVTEADGDLYWVVYRRSDAACDFVRLAAGTAEPSVLFSDGLGDFSETECETSIAVSDDGATLYYVHGGEIRGVSITRPSEVTVLARDERFPRELVVHRGWLVWLTLGADPYEDDLTGAGAVRALALPAGAPRELAGGLTEPRQLRNDGEELVLEEGGETSRERRLRVP